MSYQDLIARLEKLPGPDRELDADIFRALGWRSFGGIFNQQWWEGPSGERCKAVPFFTASIDAALTLVPEGYCWLSRSHDGSKNLAGNGSGAGGFANVHANRDDAIFFTAFAATPAIALCIAALKARQSLTSAKAP